MRRRIKSVKNTQQITKAMKMVSAAKLKRAQDRVTAARPYARKMTEILGNLSARIGDEFSSPLLDERGDTKYLVVLVSAETGAGLGELLARIERVLEGAAGPIASDTPVVTRARHLAALQVAADEMRSFVSSWESGELPAPVIAVHLRAAVTALEELVGVVDTEDVLDRVFRSFCVGK